SRSGVHVSPRNKTSRSHFATREAASRPTRKSEGLVGMSAKARLTATGFSREMIVPKRVQRKPFAGHRRTHAASAFRNWPRPSARTQLHFWGDCSRQDTAPPGSSAEYTALARE